MDFSVPSNYTGTILPGDISDVTLSVNTPYGLVAVYDSFDHKNSISPPFYLHLTSGAVNQWSFGWYYGEIYIFTGNVELLGDYYNLAGGSFSGFNYHSVTPGTWTEETSAAPLPCTMLLFGSGLVGLAAFKKVD